MKEEISWWMLEKITHGKAILFLGAGAAFGATTHEGKTSLSSDHLRDLLSDHFLGGKHKDKNLVQIADYSKYQAGLSEVQTFIKNHVHPLQPADFHKIIPFLKLRISFSFLHSSHDLHIQILVELKQLINHSLGEYQNSVQQDDDFRLFLM